MKYGLVYMTFLLISIGLLMKASAQTVSDPRLNVYQYSVPVGQSKAYLWVPPSCRDIKAIMIALNNLTERRWLEDPVIRKMAAREGIGIIWVGPADKYATGSGSNNLNADMSGNSKGLLLQMLNDFAKVSGYSEISRAYLIPTGHSAHGHFSWNVANALPERTLAVIAIKTIPLPDSFDFQNIPVLYMLGQTTEWPQYKDGRPGDRDFYPSVVRSAAAALRSNNSNNLIGIVVEPGGGHFDWSEKLARFMALFIHKACNYRLPHISEGKSGHRNALRRISPVSGWLLSANAPDSKPELAFYKAFKGDKYVADWFFDKETAKSAERLNGDVDTRKKQMPSVIQGGKVLNVTKLGYADARFIPDPDGVSFHLKPGFLNKVPTELIGAGKPLGNTGGRVRFSIVSGPAIQTGPQAFRVHFGRGGYDDIWIEESVSGNKEYRHAVQPVKVTIPKRLTQGEKQEIDFPEIHDQKIDVRSVQLKAVSSAGLPVQYSVLAGPAYIKGDHVIFTRIPVKSRYPVKITVRAYQWGRPLSPFVQSALSVTRSFFIRK